MNAEGISVVSGGNQIFIAGFTSTAAGADQLRVVGVDGAAVNIDKAFLGPQTTKPTLGESGSGSVTAGVHSVGYIITTRNGFTGAISPAVSAGTFDFTSQITASGGKQITFSLTITWPTEAASVQIVMSTTTNPFQLITVPGLGFNVPGGSSFPITATIDISDQQLELEGTDVTNNQYFLTQDTMGNGPFNPFKVVEYGPRTSYLTYDSNGSFAVYFSQGQNPQPLSEAFNKKKLPGFRKGTSAFVLRGVYYVLGPHWTFSFEDTNDLPALWASATLVDGEIGTLCVEGTMVNASGDWAAVASITGLYIFNGQYADKPISYMVDPDWRRINWNAAQTIRMSDNKDKKQILLSVPLDGATTPSHLMMFDYSDCEGVPDWERVKYSLWNLASYTPRALCVFQNPSTARMEFLIGKGTAGGVLRQMNQTDDTHPYADQTSSAIAFTYQIAPQPDGYIGNVLRHKGGYVRCQGSGVLSATSYSLDNQVAVPWSRPITLAANPGVDYFRQFIINGERCSVKFTCGTAAGDYVILSAYRHQYIEWSARR
jgi:hypothetical protein